MSPRRGYRSRPASGTGRDRSARPRAGAATRRTPPRSAQAAAIGQAVSVSGLLIVQNTGDQAVVLDRVDLIGLQGGMYRGAYIRPFPPKHGIPFTSALSYRVPRDGRTMPGATVAPHAQALVVIGLTAKQGENQWTSADIVYRYRGATYRRHAAFSGAVCAPLEKYVKSCNPPGFAQPK